MKLRLDRNTIIKLGIIGLLLFLAPYVVPFAFELVLVADFMGLEAFVLFLIYQLRHVIVALSVRVREFGSHVSATVILLASIYIFEPQVFASHVAGSGLLLALTCSVALALALWLPVIYLSVGGFT